jgi:hypothetical protein
MQSPLRSFSLRFSRVGREQRVKKVEEGRGLESKKGKRPNEKTTKGPFISSVPVSSASVVELVLPRASLSSRRPREERRLRRRTAAFYGNKDSTRNNKPPFLLSQNLIFRFRFAGPPPLNAPRNLERHSASPRPCQPQRALLLQRRFESLHIMCGRCRSRAQGALEPLEERKAVP